MIMLRGLLAFLVLLVAQACSSPLSEDELVARATQALANDDITAAELDVKTALQSNPKSAAARSLYGEIYLRQINPGAAVGELERSLETAETNETLLLLAKALLQAGDSAELVSSFEAHRYLAVSNSPEFQAVLARAYLSQTQYEEAREALAAADIEGNDYVDVTRAVFALLLEKDSESAKSILNEVVTRNPRNADAWSLLGILATRDEDRSAAAEYFAKASEANPYRLGDRLQLVTTQIRLGKGEEVEQDLAILENVIPNYPEVNFLRGQLLFDAGEYENALDAFSRVLSVNPNHAGALLLAANANARESNLTTARRQLTQFLTQQPGHVPASLQLANVWLLLGKPEKTEAVAREILKEQEMNVQALSLLAVALSAQGMHAESAQAYEQVASLQPESTQTLVALGSQQMVAGDTAAGIEQLKAAVALDPASTSAHERLIEAHLAVKDLDAAAKAGETYLAEARDNPRAYVYLGRVRLQQEDYDGAESLFEQALGLDPGNIEASGGMAALAVLNKDLDGAIASFERALEANPGDLMTSMNLGVVLEQTRDLEGMQAVLNDAVEANPAAAEPRIALARYALMQGKPGEAIGLMTPIEDTNTDDYRVHQILSSAYLSAEQPGAAVTSAGKLLELRPEDPAVLALVARVESTSGRLEVAQAHLEKALTIRPDNSDIRKMLIEVLIQQRRLDQAREQIAQLPEAVQEETPVIVVRGRLAMADREFEDAKVLFAQAFEQQRNNINLALLSSAQWSLGERDAVIDALESWLEASPDDALSRNELASLLLQLGRNDASREQYKILVDRQPENTGALNNLAWLTRESDPEAALDYIQRADKLAPGSAQIKDTYAMVELARGKFERAMSLNDKALEDAPGNPDIRYNRAQIMLAAGRIEDARRLLGELVAGPAFGSQAAAKALLTSM